MPKKAKSKVFLLLNSHKSLRAGYNFHKISEFSSLK